MAEAYKGTTQELQFPFTVSPSGGGLGIFAEEERFNAYAVMCGYTPSLEAPDRSECVALLTFRGVVQLVYGHPNEEAYWSDPRGELNHGVSEIVGSGWLESIDAYNRASFGTDSFWVDQPLRHFFVGSKDSSAQFLARDVDLEVFDGPPLKDAYTSARAEVLRRLDSSPET